jgi:hypothetical protein
MRITRVVTLSAVFLTCFATIASAAVRCLPEGAVVVASNRQVVLYDLHGLMSACSRASGRRQFLAEEPFEGTIQGKLRGRFVAVFVDEHDRDGSAISSNLIIADVGRAPRLTADFLLFDPVQNSLSADTYLAPLDFEVGSNGTVIYLGRVGDNLEVWRVNRRAQRRRYDAFPESSAQPANRMLVREARGRVSWGRGTAPF